MAAYIVLAPHQNTSGGQGALRITKMGDTGLHSLLVDGDEVGDPVRGDDILREDEEGKAPVVDPGDQKSQGEPEQGRGGSGERDSSYGLCDLEEWNFLSGGLMSGCRKSVVGRFPPEISLPMIST